MNRAGSWSEAERAILAANWRSKMDKEVSAILLEAGFKRSAEAIKNERSRRGWRRADPIKPERRGGKRPTSDGWPVMRGDDETRDRQFYQAVLRHGVECGAIIITRVA